MTFTPSDFPILPHEEREVFLTPSTAADDHPTLTFPVHVKGTLEWASKGLSSISGSNETPWQCRSPARVRAVRAGATRLLEHGVEYCARRDRGADTCGVHVCRQLASPGRVSRSLHRRRFTSP